MIMSRSGCGGLAAVPLAPLGQVFSECSLRGVTRDLAVPHPPCPPRRAPPRRALPVPPRGSGG